MFSMGTLCAVVILAVFLTELYAAPPDFSLKHSQQQARAQKSPPTGQGTTQGQEAAADGEREPINSVTVSCHPDSLEIVIQADLFGVGASVRSRDVRLGVDHDERCKATSASDEEYRITAGLLACGTKHWMTRDSLVYTNLLIYSPERPADGVVRMEEAVIPIECHYDRKYSLSSPALSPTWIPFVSRQFAVEKFSLDLTIMTSDWLYKRSSNVFYLGEDINIEASVRRGHHIGLRVFLSTCVATLTPDEHSLPRYVFIKDGCLFDSQLPNSRSRFLPRVQDNKLHLVLDAFRFHNEDRTQVFITCQMTAVPVNDAESPNKACTFTNGRWRSADGNDYLCGHCQPQNEEGHVKGIQSGQFRPRAFGGSEIQQRSWRSGLKTEQEFKKDDIVGPLLVLPTEQKTKPKSDFAAYGSFWRSGIHQKTGLIDNEVDEPEGLIENEVHEVIADKGLVPDELPSPEVDTQNVTETEDDFSPDVTDDAYDGADEDETSGEATTDFDEFVENLDTQVMEVQKNETTPDPIDINPTPVYTVYNMNITITMNDTDADLSYAKDPKR